MDEKKNLTLIFILSLPVSLVILVSCLLSFNKIFCSFFYQIIFLIGVLTVFVCLLSLRRLLAEIKYDTHVRKRHKKTIQDVYRYKLMMDPPDWDT